MYIVDLYINSLSLHSLYISLYVQIYNTHINICALTVNWV